jgi:hypothetical protein
MENLGVYPLKYAQMTVKDKTGKILEAGCGAGRILRYYHDHGCDTIGFYFINVAISKLKEIDPTLKAEVGDITKLRFADQSFKYGLAFAAYTTTLSKGWIRLFRRRTGCWKRVDRSSYPSGLTTSRRSLPIGWLTGRLGARLAKTRRGLFTR